MMDDVLIAFSLGLLLFSVKRTGFFPFPSGLILFLFVSQIIFKMSREGLVNYNMLAAFNHGGAHANYLVVQGIYSATALIALSMVIPDLNIFRGVKISRSQFEALTKSSAVITSASAVAVVVTIHLILFAIVVDWSKLWSYRFYLEAMVDENMAGIFGLEFCSTVIRVTSLFAILSVLSACLLAELKSILFKPLAIVVSACYFLILYADDSRSSVFVPGLIALYFWVFPLRGRKIIVPAAGMLAILAFFSALSGRAAYEHGLSTFPAGLVQAFRVDSGFDPFQALLDVFQGIFVTAESLQIRDAFPINYKILAFSPLPSLIDGYSSINFAAQHRLHLYVPMSGIGEAINFGWPFVGLLVVILAVIVRMHLRLASRQPAVFLLCNFLIMFSVYLLFSYPLRNGLKYAWLALYAAVLTMWLQGRSTERLAGAKASA